MAKTKTKREVRREAAEKTETTTQAFVEAGFSVEQVGRTTILYRAVSNDVLEASRALTRGRTMDCPSRNTSRED
jgi:hypothetical protein